MNRDYAPRGQKAPRSARKKAHKSGHWTLKVSIPFHVSMSRLWEGKSSVCSVVARDCIQLWHCHRSLFPAASTSTAAAPARRTTLGQDEVGFLKPNFTTPLDTIAKQTYLWKNSTSTAKVMYFRSFQSFPNCPHFLRSWWVWDLKVTSIGAKLTGFLSDVSLPRLFPKPVLQPADNHWWINSSSIAASIAASSITATRRTYRHQYNSQSDHECI